MNLADQIRAYLWPVFLQVVPEIVTVVTHVEGDLLIDLARQPIPHRARIAVLANRPVSGVPRCDLLTGAHVASEDRLEATHFPHRQSDLSIGVSRERPDELAPIPIRHFECVV